MRALVTFLAKIATRLNRMRLAGSKGPSSGIEVATKVLKEPRFGARPPIDDRMIEMEAVKWELGVVADGKSYCRNVR